MNNANEESIAELLRPSLRHLGVDLIDVHWSGKGRGAVLRLVIDREGGVTLDDCELASNTASAVLDAYDPLPGAILLFVLTAVTHLLLHALGLDATLEVFNRLIGSVSRLIGS